MKIVRWRSNKFFYVFKEVVVVKKKIARNFWWFLFLIYLCGEKISFTSKLQYSLEYSSELLRHENFVYRFLSESMKTYSQDSVYLKCFCSFQTNHSTKYPFFLPSYLNIRWLTYSFSMKIFKMLSTNIVGIQLGVAFSVYFCVILPLFGKQFITPKAAINKMDSADDLISNAASLLFH